MADYKVSVVIPTFNTGDFLLGSLEAFKSQTIGFDNIELIYVDDFSSDEYTLDLLASIDNKYDNCRVFYLSENSGFPGTPRNYGLDVASSDYVIFSDHDDTYEKDAFEVLYNKITEENADVVISNFKQVFEDKTIKFKSIYKDIKEVNVSSIDESRNLLRIPAAIWTRLFRKDFLIENNIRFPERMLAEDVYFASNTSLNASKIIYLNSYYGYNYKIRDSEKDKSTIHIRNRKYIEAILNGYYEIVYMLDQQNKQEYGVEIFRPHLSSWLYTIILSKLSSADKKELFSKSWEVFDRYYSEDPYFKGRYSVLAQLILNKEFDLAVEEANNLELIQENMNDVGLNKSKRLFKKIKNKFRR